MFSIVVTICVVATILLTIVIKWYLAKGVLKPVYWLGIVLCTVFIIMNTTIAVTKSDMQAMALYHLLNAYVITMHIKGLRRLKREKDEASLR